MAGGRPPLKRQRVLLSPSGDHAEKEPNPAEASFQLRRMTRICQWPFANEAQELRMQLVDHTLTEQYNKDVHVYVQMMRVNAEGVEMDESRYLTADKRVLQLDSTGVGSFVFSIAKNSCGEDADDGQHPYHIVLAAKSRAQDIPAIETWISPPISVVPYRLEIAHEVSEIPPVWFKDKGGKRNVIKVGFTLRDSERRIVKDRVVACKVTLKYESGETVPSQKILNVRPESHLVLNSPRGVQSEGKGQKSGSNGVHAPLASTGIALIRIDEVSKNHRGQSFTIEIGPDLDEQPQNVDIGCLNTAAIAVRSKQNSGRPSRITRAPAETLPKFPGGTPSRQSNGDAGYSGLKGSYSPGVGGVSPLRNLGPFEQRVQQQAQSRGAQAAEQTHATLSQVTQAQVAKAHAEAQAQAQAHAQAHQVQAEAVRAVQVAAAQSAQMNTVKKNALDAQNAVMQLASWVKEVQKLKTIQWKLCGVDGKGEPVHFIPGNPNSVIAPILQGYHEHVEHNLVAIAKALQLQAEMQSVLKHSPGVSGSPHLIAMASPQMQGNNQVGGKPIVTPVMPQGEGSHGSQQATGKVISRDNSLYPIDQTPMGTNSGSVPDQVKAASSTGAAREQPLLTQQQRQEAQHAFGSQSDLARMGMPQPYPISSHFPSFEHGSSMDSLFELFREKPNATQTHSRRAGQVANVHFVLAESYPNADPMGKKQCLPALDENRNLLGFIVVPDGASRANWTFECWTTFKQITNEDKDYLSELVLKHQQNQHVKLKVVRGERQISEMVEEMLGPPDERFEYLSPAGVLQAMK